MQIYYNAQEIALMHRVRPQAFRWFLRKEGIKKVGKQYQLSLAFANDLMQKFISKHNPTIRTD